MLRMEDGLPLNILISLWNRQIRTRVQKSTNYVKIKSLTIVYSIRIVRPLYSITEKNDQNTSFSSQHPAKDAVLRSEFQMSLSKETRQKLRATFGAQAKKDLENLPIKVPRVDKVPVRGSVHIGTGRVISRDEINKRFDKAFSKNKG